jgi:predicted ester cyclase
MAIDDDIYLKLPSARSEPNKHAHTQGSLGKSLLGMFFACLLSALVATFCTRLWLLRQSPKLWDQNLRPEYAFEPLGKKTIRFFDGYLMARAGIDGPSDFQANVNRALAPDVVFESVAWGPGGRPLRTQGRDTWTHSGEERRFRKAFGSTELFTQMMFFGDNATGTTASYGTLFWGGELFGVPPPNKWIELRVCDFYRIEKDPSGIYGGLITYNFMMIDWPDVLHRAGYSLLPPARLEDGVVLPPAANDGVPAPFSILAAIRDGNAAREVAKRILSDNWSGDGNPRNLWHSDLTFYGPRGVGLARSVQTFEEDVLKPFHAAFANRTLIIDILTCEGNYVAATGHIWGYHVAPWLGLAPSHRRLKLRFGMHWRIIEGRAKEGWAIFDIPNLYRQLGIDFFQLAVKASLRK